MSEFFYTREESPVGELLLAGDESGLRFIHFMNGRHPIAPSKDWTPRKAPFAEVIRQLSAYFRGQLKDFDVPLAMEGTEFQLRVWQRLRRIPYGETISYGKLAHEIGAPKGARAVGLANGQNPIPIIVPCHRVIGSNGNLTGFGGGMDNKRRLLELERGQGRLL